MLCREALSWPALWPEAPIVSAAGGVEQRRAKQLHRGPAPWPDDRCANPRNYPPASPQGSPHGFDPKMNIYTNLSEIYMYIKILH